jgi:NADH-quinone oxidoreductase subunit C
MPDEESQTDADASAEDNEAEETPANGEQATAPEGPAAEAPDGERPAEQEEEARPSLPAGGIADLLADAVAEAFPDVKLEAYQGMTDVFVEVERDDILNVMSVVRVDPRLDLKFLRCLWGVDQEEDGFEVLYHLMSLEKKHDVVIKTKVSRENAHVASVTSVWKAANWHERETRDMFGITFDDHPHLVPLLLPEDMTDHFPLRKDNPLAEIEEWQGDELPEEGYGGSKGR